MIPDGFNRRFVDSGYLCVYRPMAAHVRDAVKAELADMPDDLFAVAVNDMILRQVVWKNWERIEELPNDVFHNLFASVTTPPENEENLHRCAVLSAEYPHLASTSCRSCRDWWWNPLTGELAQQMGQPLRRPEGGLLLCQTPAGCPKGTMEDPLEFTPENRQAYRHWEMAGGAGCPDDELVRANWTIINKARDDARSKRLRQHPATDGGAVGGGRIRPAVHPRHVPVG